MSPRPRCFPLQQQTAIQRRQNTLTQECDRQRTGGLGSFSPHHCLYTTTVSWLHTRVAAAAAASGAGALGEVRLQRDERLLLLILGVKDHVRRRIVPMLSRVGHKGRVVVADALWWIVECEVSEGSRIALRSSYGMHMSSVATLQEMVWRQLVYGSEGSDPTTSKLMLWFRSEASITCVAVGRSVYVLCENRPVVWTMPSCPTYPPTHTKHAATTWCRP